VSVVVALGLVVAGLAVGFASARPVAASLGRPVLPQPPELVSRPAAAPAPMTVLQPVLEPAAVPVIAARRAAQSSTAPPATGLDSIPAPKAPSSPVPFGQGAYLPGSDVIAPVALTRTSAHYTPAALRAKIQGVVVLEVVVEPDGSVGQARVIRSLDPTYGLDAEALIAAASWTFTPGTRNGDPVPVICEIEMDFRLH
jgi:periplasmic protein TonB